MFDVLVDAFRNCATEWLEARRREVVSELRRLQSEELAIVRVLDERGRVDVSRGLDGESARTVREKVETARALESLPAVATAAHAGVLSGEQLSEVVKLADPETDAEWAARAPNMTPADLARKARQRSKPTVEESMARHGRRRHWMQWDHEHTMLRYGGELPDLSGVKFEATLNELIEAMKPRKGQPWETRERRGADALLQMCDAVAAVERIETPQLAPQPLFCIDVPPEGPVEVAGIPLPDAMVERLRAGARMEPVLVDEHGAPVAVGTISSAVSPKVRRAVLLRDGHCRCGNCDLRYGLQVHHLRPRTWGGGDEISNLAMVASRHHPMLVPHGPYALVGNPNEPDGLRMEHIDDLTPEEAHQVGLPRRRRRTGAA